MDTFTVIREERTLQSVTVWRWMQYLVWSWARYSHEDWRWQLTRCPLHRYKVKCSFRLSSTKVLSSQLPTLPECGVSAVLLCLCSRSLGFLIVRLSSVIKTHTLSNRRFKFTVKYRNKYKDTPMSWLSVVYARWNAGAGTECVDGVTFCVFLPPVHQQDNFRTLTGKLSRPENL